MDTTNKIIQLPDDEIRSRVVKVDEKWLTVEVLEMLLDCAPNDEDLESIAPYDGDPEMLATCEHFFYVVNIIIIIINK
jgi:hypothetical protein